MGWHNRRSNPLVKKSLVLFWIYCFLMLCWSAIAAEQNVGTTGGATTEISIGARAAGMGDAFVGVADDVNCIYWNPAGLGIIGETQFSATHTEWFAGTRYEWVGFAQSFTQWVTAGIDAAFFYTGQIPRTVESSIGGYEEDGVFEYNNTIFRFAVGSGAYRKIRVGASFQVLQQEVTYEEIVKQQVPDRKARSTFVNLGILYEPIDDVRLGVSVQNISGKIEGLGEKNEPAPRIIRFGGAYTMYVAQQGLPQEIEAEQSSGNKLVIAADVIKPVDGSIGINLGLEYSFQNGFVLRGGYQSSTDFDLLSSLRGGLGYVTPTYRVDYAFVPYGDIGNTHRVTFTLSF